MMYEANFRGGFQLTNVQFRSIRRFQGSVYFRSTSACLQRTATSRDLVTSRLMTTLSIRHRHGVRRTSPACRTSGLAPVVTTCHVHVQHGSLSHCCNQGGTASQASIPRPVKNVSDSANRVWHRVSIEVFDSCDEVR